VTSVWFFAAHYTCRRLVAAQFELAQFELADLQRLCYNQSEEVTVTSSLSLQRKNVMGKGNHSQKNDKKTKKPKQDKKKETKTTMLTNPKH